MKKLVAGLVPALVAAAGLAGSGSAAQAAHRANQHTILRSVASYVVYDSSESHCKNGTSSVLTEVTLRRGHIANDLTVDVYVGQAWKRGRATDVPIWGKVSVRFFTCVPDRLLFNPRTGAAYNTRIVVTTMPRSRDTMGSRIINGD